MILLRLLAILLGGLLLLVPPLFLSAEGPMHVEQDVLTVTVGCSLVALLAASFFYIGVFGHKMKKSKRLRIIGGVLLVFPMVAAVALVTEMAETQFVYLSAAMFCLAAVLFVNFVYPGERSRKQRPMRKRDVVEPYLEPSSRL